MTNETHWTNSKGPFRNFETKFWVIWYWEKLMKYIECFDETFTNSKEHNGYSFISLWEFPGISFGDNIINIMFQYLYYYRFGYNYVLMWVLSVKLDWSNGIISYWEFRNIGFGIGAPIIVHKYIIYFDYSKYDNIIFVIHYITTFRDKSRGFHPRWRAP